MKTAYEFLNAASDTMRERGKTYDKQGTEERSMGRTVCAFNAITGRDLTEYEGWLLMLLLKQVRQWAGVEYHEDSALDSVAYAALLAESLASPTVGVDAPSEREPLGRWAGWVNLNHVAAKGHDVVRACDGMCLLECDGWEKFEAGDPTPYPADDTSILEFALWDGSVKALVGDTTISDYAIAAYRHRPKSPRTAWHTVEGDTAPRAQDVAAWNIGSTAYLLKSDGWTACGPDGSSESHPGYKGPLEYALRNGTTTFHHPRPNQVAVAWRYAS